MTPRPCSQDTPSIDPSVGRAANASPGTGQRARVASTPRVAETTPGRTRGPRSLSTLLSATYELRTPPSRARHVGVGTDHRTRTRNNALCHRPSLQPCVVYSKRATSCRTRGSSSDQVASMRCRNSSKASVSDARIRPLLRSHPAGAEVRRHPVKLLDCGCERLRCRGRAKARDAWSSPISTVMVDFPASPCESASTAPRVPACRTGAERDSGRYACRIGDRKGSQPTARRRGLLTCSLADLFNSPVPAGQPRA